MATRREKVLIDVTVTGDRDLMALAAAAALADKSLDNLGGTRLGNVEREISKVSKTASSLDGSSRDIDRFSGRLGLARDAILTLGTAAIPIGAVIVPAMAALANQLGGMALAGGTAVIAFQGVGDALKAVNEAALDPTQENLAEASEVLRRLSPEARAFVQQIQAMRPAFDQLRDSAAAGLFPGLSAGLREASEVFPAVERVFLKIGQASGDLAADLGEALNSERGREFLHFLETEVPDAITAAGQTVGNLTAGLAELWMAFAPLNRDVSDILVNASQGFDAWAAGLAETQGFQDFVDYLRTNGPRVAETLGSVADAVLQIVEAMAPLGGPALIALESVAKVVSAIADSNAGPEIMSLVGALILLNRGMQAFDKVQKTTAYQKTTTSLGEMRSAFVSVSSAQDRAKMSATQYAAAEQKRSAAITSGMKTVGRGAGLLAGLGVAASGVASGMGLANTATLGMMGTIGGPWGAAAGAAVGLALDLASAQDSTAEKTEGLTDTLNQQTGAITKLTYEWAANKIVTAGVAGDMDALGISARDLSDALLGTGDGAQTYVDVLNMATNPTGTAEQQKAAQNVLAFLDSNKAATQGVIDKQKQVREVAREAASGMDEGAAAAARLTGNYYDLAAANERLTSSLERSNRVLDTRGSLRDYEAALDDFSDTLGEVGNKARLVNKNGTINIDLPKGREVQERLDAIGREALEVANNLKGTDRVEALRQARRDFVDAAKKAGMGREAIQKLADQIFKLPTQRAVDIAVRTEGADAHLAALQTQLNSIDGDYYVNIHARLPNLGGFGPQITSADGSTVPGPRYPYGDKVHALVAPGEEIISNRYGQADRYRDVLKAINANRFNAGGTVMRVPRSASPTSVSVGSPSVSVGGAQVRVFIDGREVRAIVRSEQDADQRYRANLEDRP